MYDEQIKVDKNDYERGVAVRMPLPDLSIVGYRVPVEAKLADGTTVDIFQYRGSRMTVHDEPMVLHREAEQLQGLCDWLQDQLLAATGGMRFAHQFLVAVGAGLAEQGVEMDATNFTARNGAAQYLRGKAQGMVKEAEQRGITFGKALRAGLERYQQVTGEPVDPLVKMAMEEVVHAALMDFLRTHWAE
jgi:hypothetical protein